MLEQRFFGKMVPLSDNGVLTKSRVLKQLCEKGVKKVLTGAVKFSVKKFESNFLTLFAYRTIYKKMKIEKRTT